MNKPKLLLFIGSMLLLAAFTQSIRTALFFRRSIPTIGQVVSYTDKGDNSPAVIKVGVKAGFTTQKGQYYTAASFFTVNPDKHPIGSTLGVRYNPNNPREAHIDSLLDLWGFELIMVSVGAAALAAGISGI